MNHTLRYGRSSIDLDVADAPLPAAPPLIDIAAAVSAALEQPFQFPPLRRALTPDDRVAIVLDEGLPRLAELLPPVLEHLALAGVQPSAVTLVSATAEGGQRWLDDLPDDFADVRVEVHDPKERKNLAYLATTASGTRVYVNRTAVEADQLVVVGRPDVEPLVLRGGAGLLYPALGDEAARRRTSDDEPDADGRREEAAEIAWLLGAPFLLQVIPGAGDEFAHIVGGTVASTAEALRLYESRWGLTTDRFADTVVATISGDPALHDFAVVARALAHAASVVQPDGRIVLLTEAAPTHLPAVEGRKRTAPPEAKRWAAATARARVSLLSSLPTDVAEDLLVTPLEHAAQTRRLMQAGGSVLILEDADRALPRVEEIGVGG